MRQTAARAGTSPFLTSHVLMREKRVFAEKVKKYHHFRAETRFSS